MILRDSVAVLPRSRTGVDDHGNDVFGYDSVDERLSPAQVNPVSSSENIAGQDSVVTRWRVFLPPVGVGDRFSRIRWRGGLFEVDGDVEVHTDLRGRVHHRELLMVRFDG